MNKNFIKAKCYNVLSHITYGKSREKFRKKYCKYKKFYKENLHLSSTEAQKMILDVQTSITDSHSEIKTSITDSHSEIKTSIADTRLEIQRSIADSRSEIKTSIAESLSKIKKNILNKQNALLNDNNFIKYIHIPASNVHKEVFTKYKNIYKGKKVVLVGAGPTLKDFIPIEDAIYIGVNYTFTNENISLDYLFIQDLHKDGYQERANHYKPLTCKKFYGIHYLVDTPSQEDREIAKAEPFYFVDQPVPTSRLATFSPDITTRPLHTWSSVIFPALEFALWTNPDELYIVGCDCGVGHYFHNTPEKMCPYVDRIIYGWQQMANFIRIHYPNMKVYSINPVGLKELFEDIYQATN